MGDHRPHIKIEMEFHGIQRKMETDCNWDFNGGSEKIASWIEDVIAEGMAVYAFEVNKWQRESEQQEKEKAERADYERLKKKFEGPPQPKVEPARLEDSAIHKIFNAGTNQNDKAR